MNISYDMIERTELPVFNGIFFGNKIYEFTLVETQNDRCFQREAVLSGVSDRIKPEYIPGVMCALYESICDDGCILECGEGSYGGIGFVCLSTPEKEIVFLACFENSNPFVRAELRNDCICAENNLRETWIFRMNADGLPSVQINQRV